MNEKKYFADEVMMNIVCNEIETATTDAALRGGRPPDGSILDLPHTGARTMLKIKQIWTTLRHTTHGGSQPGKEDGSHADLLK